MTAIYSERLQGRHAFVTGGASGIGLAISRALTEAGARVTMASRNGERLAEVASTLPGAAGIVMDVCDVSSVSNAFEQAGQVDILVNNSGIVLTAPFHKITAEQFSKMIAVNLSGVFHCTQAALPGMRERDFGRIITISSTAGLTGYAYTSAYAATKHAVVGLTRSLALELASRNITANCVCPGFTNTDIVSDALANITGKTGRTTEEALAEFVRHNPQGRLIEPEEVAEVVLWLCAENSRSITGQSIAVAGGEIT